MSKYLWALPHLAWRLQGLTMASRLRFNIGSVALQAIPFGHFGTASSNTILSGWVQSSKSKLYLPSLPEVTKSQIKRWNQCSMGTVKCAKQTPTLQLFSCTHQGLWTDHCRKKWRKWSIFLWYLLATMTLAPITNVSIKYFTGKRPQSSLGYNWLINFS